MATWAGSAKDTRDHDREPGRRGRAGLAACILKELEVGGEAMVEYAPDGLTRATYLNVKGSDLTRKGAEACRRS
jgi:hypothetical protein